MLEVNAQARLAVIREKVEAGQRLSFDDGVFLSESADLFTLGELANLVRERKNGQVTYYNVNTHLNPTNVCVYRCTFCAFRSDLRGETPQRMQRQRCSEMILQPLVDSAHAAAAAAGKDQARDVGSLDIHGASAIGSYSVSPAVAIDG